MPALSLGERIVRDAWRIVPQRALSEIIGWGARFHLPVPLRSAVLGSFARTYGIDVDEAEKPLASYEDLEAFFVRKLRTGARPIDPDPLTIVSPADGTVVSSGHIERGQLYETKDDRFDLGRLLGDDDLARRLEGGTYNITYLSPRDYHRVHAPISGGVTSWFHVPGDLFPVSDRSVRREPGLFARNERFVTVLDGEGCLAVVVMVAAVGVGHITASYDEDVATHAGGFHAGEVRRKTFAVPPRLARGDELGTFHLGSTTVVLFEPGRTQLLPLAPGARVRMGEVLGRLVRPQAET